MSTWKDPFTTPPAPDSIIWLRRCPEVTPPLQGVWRPTEGIVALGPEDSWSLPCHLVSRWRPAPYAIPVPATDTRTGWRDPALYPPAANQSCWIRRSFASTTALPAVWHPEEQAFGLTVPEACIIRIAWYYVWQWKPQPGAAGLGC